VRSEEKPRPYLPELYPVMFTPAFFSRCPVLIVGGGRVAERKIKSLLWAGAKVRLIAPQVTPDLAGFSSNGQIEWLARPWLPGDVRDFSAALLIFAATDNPTVNAQVQTEARQYGRLLNRADSPATCDFTVPGVVRSGEITLAVSTGIYTNGNLSEITEGANPALSVYLRKKLKMAIGPEYSRLSGLLRELRPKVKQAITPARRPDLWQRMVDSEVLELLRQQRDDEARQLLENYIREESENPNEEIY
jgi:precorrin-2 dehydrogenase/sirohydrochlorin ferrochelatase